MKRRHWGLLPYTLNKHLLTDNATVSTITRFFFFLIFPCEQAVAIEMITYPDISRATVRAAFLENQDQNEESSSAVV